MLPPPGTGNCSAARTSGQSPAVSGCAGAGGQRVARASGLPARPRAWRRAAGPPGCTPGMQPWPVRGAMQGRPGAICSLGRRAAGPRAGHGHKGGAGGGGPGRGCGTMAAPSPPAPAPRERREGAGASWRRAVGRRRHGVGRVRSRRAPRRGAGRCSPASSLRPPPFRFQSRRDDSGLRTEGRSMERQLAPGRMSLASPTWRHCLLWSLRVWRAYSPLTVRLAVFLAFPRRVWNGIHT